MRGFHFCQSHPSDSDALHYYPMVRRRFCARGRGNREVTATHATVKSNHWMSDNGKVPVAFLAQRDFFPRVNPSDLRSSTVAARATATANSFSEMLLKPESPPASSERRRDHEATSTSHHRGLKSLQLGCDCSSLGDRVCDMDDLQSALKHVTMVRTRTRGAQAQNRLMSSRSRATVRY